MRCSQWLLPRLAWALAAALAACAPAGGPGATALVLADPPRDGSALWRVRVSFGSSRGQCLTLGQGALAEVNGEELELLDRGGGVPTPSGGFHCRGPYAEGSVHPSPDGMARLRVTDGARDIVSADISSLTTERTLSWVDPPDGSLRPDTEVALLWTPASDDFVLARASAAVTARPDDLARPSPIGAAPGIGQFLRDGSLIRFRTGSWNGASTEAASGTLRVRTDLVTLAVGNVQGEIREVTAAAGWHQESPELRYSFSP